MAKVPGPSRRACPSQLEDVAEAYALGKLDLGCPACADFTRQTLVFIGAMREAMRDSHPAEPVR
jgi:hypothetical protein